MRQRDLGVLFICAVAIFISFQQEPGDGFRIRRVWTHSLDIALYEDGQVPQPWEKLPPPVIVDVDSDGNDDVVLLTKEPSIKLLARASLKAGTSKKNDFKTAEVAKEATLLSSIIRLSEGRQPAALAVGFIDPPPKSPVKLRKKVIAVVTQDWTVLCYDEHLKLMWETNLQDFVPEGFWHKEIAVTITPVGVFKGDRGMIIVAGSTGHELTFGGDEEEADPAAADEEDNPQDELLIEQDIHHFSYYAVEGGRGGLRWSHEAGDYETTVMDDENNLSPQHNYKLDVQSNEQHQDEVDWRQYRESVLSSLPHSWRRRDDTWLELKHFAKQRRAKVDVSAAAANSAGHSLLTGAQSAAEVLDRHVGTGGASPIQGLAGPLAPPPNVVVAHRGDGLDVVHLFSGRVLTQVRLLEGVHADVNKDGAIDHIYSLAGHNLASRDTHDKVAAEFAASEAANHAPQPGCMVVATSGVPIADHLFNASACHNKKDRPAGALKGLSTDWAKGPSGLDAAQPVVMPSINFPGKLDTVFLLSNGRVTSVGPDGSVNWQVQTSATWRKEHIVVATGSDHADAVRSDSVIVASLKYVNLHSEVAVEEADVEDLQLVAVGENNIVLVSSEGRIRTTMSLPRAPVSAPVVGDFNDDGVVDLIVTTATAYYGFAIERRPNVGGALFAALVAILLIVLGTVWVMAVLDADTDESEDGRKYIRSTDDDDDYDR